MPDWSHSNVDVIFDKVMYDDSEKYKQSTFCTVCSKSRWESSIWRDTMQTHRRDQQLEGVDRISDVEKLDEDPCMFDACKSMFGASCTNFE